VQKKGSTLDPSELLRGQDPARYLRFDERALCAVHKSVPSASAAQEKRPRRSGAVVHRVFAESGLSAARQLRSLPASQEPGAMTAMRCPAWIRAWRRADAAAGLSPGELAVVKRCLRRIYSNMKSRPAGAGRSRQTHFHDHPTPTARPPGSQRPSLCARPRGPLEELLSGGAC